MKDKAFFYKKVRDLAQELGEPGIMPTTYKLSEHLGVSALARIAEYGGIKSVAKDIGLELRTGSKEIVDRDKPTTEIVDRHKATVDKLDATLQLMAEQAYAISKRNGTLPLMPPTSILMEEFGYSTYKIRQVGGATEIAKSAGLLLTASGRKSYLKAASSPRVVESRMLLEKISDQAIVFADIQGVPNEMPDIDLFMSEHGYRQRDIDSVGGPRLIARYAGFNSSEPTGEQVSQANQNVDTPYAQMCAAMMEFFELETREPFDLLSIKQLKRLSEDKRTRDMVFRRASGETLESVALADGITRERVRQIVKPYDALIKTVQNRRGKEVDQNNRKQSLDFIEKEMESSSFSKKVLDAFHPEAYDYLVSEYFSDPEEADLAWLEARLAVPRLLSKRGKPLEQSNFDGAKWSEKKAIEVLKVLASNLGTPNLMPKQREQPTGLRGIISRLGGQSHMAQLSGLKYQGQVVGDQGRVYWTDQRVVNALREVAAAVNRPNIMPSQRDVKNYFNADRIIIHNLLGTQRKRMAKRTWSDLAELAGLTLTGHARVKKDLGFLRDFVKSLGNHLETMDASEIFVMFRQQGLSKKAQKDSSFNKVLDAIQSGFLPKEELSKWAESGSSDIVERIIESKSGFEPLSKEASREPTDDAESEGFDAGPLTVPETLPDLTANKVLNSLEFNASVLTESDSDEEAVRFFIAKAKAKLWSLAFDKGDVVIHSLNDGPWDTVTQTVKSDFESEYLSARDLELPKGFSFRDLTGQLREPKLMQKLIATRVRDERRVLNLSGTGTGKTLSAILASRVIKAGVTVIVCPNSTVSNWRKNIVETFGDSDVVTKTWGPLWKTDSSYRYLVVNHEMLVNSNEASIKAFIDQNRIEFVVIDEIHKAKQRSLDQESQRRRLLNGLITDHPDDEQGPCVLGLSATPVINNLNEGRSLVELVTSEEHDDIGSELNIENCMKLYQKFCTLGFRQRSEALADLKFHYHKIDCSGSLTDILELGPRPHPQQIEAVLLPIKLDTIVECLRPKTVVFTEYVTGIIPKLVQAIRGAGFSVAIHSGSDKAATDDRFSDSLDQFINGDLNVLVASTSTLATGVDGLQTVCNNVVFATLPWTNTDLEQALGRFDRHGFIFESLDIHIPKTEGLLNEIPWSYCSMKLSRLESKKDLASAAVDGQIPEESQALSPAKASEYWRNWLDRLERGDIQTVARREIKVPLDGTHEEKLKRIATYGDFGELNRRWNNSLGSTTHARLETDPTEWAQYHTLYREHRASWPIVPVEEVASWLVQRSGWIVADLGCGEDLLREAVGEAHDIRSFDHVAINENVVECDLADVPLEDDEVDVSVFCLSLMGSNFSTYLDEAYRITKPLGFLHIVESTSRFGSPEQFAESLKGYGFEILEMNSRWRFTHIVALKKTGQVSDSRNISF